MTISSSPCGCHCMCHARTIQCWGRSLTNTCGRTQVHIDAGVRFILTHSRLQHHQAGDSSSPQLLHLRLQLAVRCCSGAHLLRPALPLLPASMRAKG